MTDISRRTILRGAAYTVPTVALLSMTAQTAEAASMPPKTETPVPNTKTDVPVQTISSPELAHTGTNVPLMVGAAAGAIAAGGVITTLAKRT